MKKALSVVLSVLMILACVAVVFPAASAYSIMGTYGVLTYSIENGEATITNCSSSAQEVVIPAEIEGNPVTSIGDRAFDFCLSLTTVTIPQSVTSIGDRAFEHCTGLTTITIPSGVTAIGINAFINCSKLTEIRVDENNSAYCDVDGVLFSKDKTKLVCFPSNKQGSYTIPDGVKSISAYAFYLCDLTNVTIPNGVTEIGVYAFYRSINLRSVNIPNTVTEIGNYAFEFCGKLTEINIPESVKVIGYSAFYDCTLLSYISVDEENTAFSSVDGVLYSKDMKKLIIYPPAKAEKSFAIPVSVTAIEDNAFAYSDYLESLTIPVGVTAIGKGAFSYTSRLASAVIPSGVTKLEDALFTSSGVLTDVTIPASVTEIAPDAFYRCFMSVTIHGYAATAAETFAKTAGLNFVVIEEDFPADITSPEYAITNECFLITVTADKSVGRIKLYNETGTVIGNTLVSKTADGDGTNTWVLSLKIGTKGIGRNITVKDGDGNELGRFSIDIFEKATATAPVMVKQNESFQINATTNDNVKTITIIDENGNAVESTVVNSYADPVYSRYTQWQIAMKADTVGWRNFRLIDSDTNKELCDITLNVLTEDGTNIAEPQTTVSAPDSAYVNEKFTVTVQTKKDIEKPIIVNENNGRISATIVSKSVDGITTTWVLSLSVGTKGDNREFSVKDSINSNPVLATFSIKITEPAEEPPEIQTMIYSVSAPASAKVNEKFNVTAVVSSDLVKGKFTNEKGSKIGSTIVSMTRNGDKTTFVYSLSIGSEGNRTLTYFADYDKHSEFPFSKSFNITINK